MTKAADRRRRARRVAVRFAQLHAYSLTCLLDLGVGTARYERFELLQLRNRPAVLSLVELLPAGPMADKDDNSPIDFDEAEGAEAAEGFSLPAAGDAPLSVGRTELDEESLGDDFAIPFAEGAEAAEGTTLPAAEDAPLGDDRGEGNMEDPECKLCSCGIDRYEQKDFRGHCEYCWHEVLPFKIRESLRKSIVQGFETGDLPSWCLSVRVGTDRYRDAVAHLTELWKQLAEDAPETLRNAVRRNAHSDAEEALQQAQANASHCSENISCQM